MATAAKMSEATSPTATLRCACGYDESALMECSSARQNSTNASSQIQQGRAGAGLRTAICGVQRDVVHRRRQTLVVAGHLLLCAGHMRDGFLLACCEDVARKGEREGEGEAPPRTIGGRPARRELHRRCVEAAHVEREPCSILNGERGECLCTDCSIIQTPSHEAKAGVVVTACHWLPKR